MHSILVTLCAVLCIRAWKTLTTINLGCFGTQRTSGWKQAIWPIWAGPFFLFELMAEPFSGTVLKFFLSQGLIEGLISHQIQCPGSRCAQVAVILYTNALCKEIIMNVPLYLVLPCLYLYFYLTSILNVMKLNKYNTNYALWMNFTCIGSV